MKHLLFSLILLVLPVAVFAQATLTGTVREVSGSVLPGVQVEAKSPALGEDSRSTVTNTAGQFTIAGLPPGRYSLTFRLSGFTTTTSDDIELSGTETVTMPPIAMSVDVTPFLVAGAKVVCGLTILPGRDVDPKVRQDVPKGGPTPMIRKIVPSICVSNPAPLTLIPPQQK